MAHFLIFTLFVFLSTFCVGCKESPDRTLPAEQTSAPTAQDSNPVIVDKPANSSLAPDTPIELPEQPPIVAAKLDPPVVTESVEQAKVVKTGISDDLRKPKTLWAQSYLWAKAPDIQVEKWLSDAPYTKGKYVLLEIWATWCSQCVRSIPDLNSWQEKYADELVVIGITDEPEETVTNFAGPKINYYSGIDTQGRVKDQLGVKGFPHVVIIEPGGYVVWEGFPYLKDYELTGELLEKILAVGRKSISIKE